MALDKRKKIYWRWHHLTGITLSALHSLVFCNSLYPPLFHRMSLTITRHHSFLLPLSTHLLFYYFVNCSCKVLPSHYIMKHSKLVL